MLAGTGGNSTSGGVFLTEQAERAGADGSLRGALLQQTHARRPVPALPPSRAEHAPAPHALQHPGPLRRQNRRGHHPAAGARMPEHHRHQGSGRPRAPREPVAGRARAALRDSQRRRFAHPAVHGGGRAGRHQRGLKCHPAPSGLRAWCAAFAAGKPKRPSSCTNDTTRFFKDLFPETNPIPVKAALAMLGLIKEEYRLPSCPCPRENGGFCRRR